MSVLTVIWLAALGLIGCALSWMTALIILRFFHERRAVRRHADRRAVEEALVGVLQGHTNLDVSLAPYRGRARLMAETLLNLLGIMRGSDLKLVIDALCGVGVDQVLRERLGRGSLIGRLACVEALGAFPGVETQGALRIAAEGAPPKLRLAALRSLTQAGGEVSVTRLVDDLNSGALTPSGPFADLLRRVVEVDHAGAARALARTDLTNVARIMLLEALGASGAYEVVPYLAVHMKATRPDIRAATVRAMGQLMHPLAEPALAAALRDPDWEVRCAAADAIGAARLATLVDDLAERLNDSVWRVRFQSATALARFGAPGIQRLRDAAAGSSAIARDAAALTLAELGAG